MTVVTLTELADTYRVTTSSGPENDSFLLLHACPAGHLAFSSAHEYSYDDSFHGIVFLLCKNSTVPCTSPLLA